MKLAAPALAAVVLLALAGCAPASSAAHQKCVDYLVQTYEEITPDASAEDVAEITAASDRGCAKDQAEDPAAFKEQWGD